MQNKIDQQAWPFVQAARILERVDNKVPKKGYVLFETGYGPSGLPHIGTFSEVARTSMVMHALKVIAPHIPSKLVCFSDDMDGLRKVPTNIPNQEMIAKYINMPLSRIPDPFQECKSYGEYMNNKLKSFLDKFEFEYEFMSATECYAQGLLNDVLTTVARHYDQIMQVMLATLREERQQTYSPFLPICPETGQVLQVPISKVNIDTSTIEYTFNSKKYEISFLNGCCKLQWKPDFAARWAAFDVDYEMYGKEHRPNFELYSKLCRVMGGNPPVQYFYELFLDEQGGKISKSSGNGITIDKWLKYATVESLALFIYKSPEKAKRLSFDTIPQMVDEYISYNAKYHASQDLDEQRKNPVYHVHKGQVPIIDTGGLTFALLINLVSTCNTPNKEVVWGFVSKYTACKSAYLDSLIDYALEYYADFVHGTKNFARPSDQQKVMLQDIKGMLLSLQEIDAQHIQNGLYEIGKRYGYENLGEFFSDLYKILLGQASGPRIGSFIALLGIEKTCGLIDEAINV